MNKVELPAVTAERVLGMIALRETTRKLLDCQLHDGSDAEVQLLQNELKQQYTAFKAQYESRGEVQPYWDGMRWLYY